MQDWRKIEKILASTTLSAGQIRSRVIISCSQKVLHVSILLVESFLKVDMGIEIR